MPIMPTVLPGPTPLRFNGLYMVMPAQNIGAAISLGRVSGILKVKCSWIRT